MEICFATNNENKVREVAALLPPSFSIRTLQSIGCTDELPEEQDTLEGNSLQKAQYVFDRYNIPCIADDTGLEIAALDGRPGVYSARYAGSGHDSEANMAKVLSEMTTAKDRSAKFRTVITFLHSGGIKQVGLITSEKSGREGFGYDPIFKPAGYEVSFAEMSSEEKNAISHRGRAVEKLVTYLQSHENDLISASK